MRSFIASVLCAALLACAPTPRPRVLEEVDQARAGQQAKMAETLAPQAHLAAEKLRRAALEASDEGDVAGSQILGEHAMAAYSRAFILARLAKAEQRRAEAAEKLKVARTALDDLDAQHVQVAAEAEAIEMRVKVARDALPLAANEPASAERERARLDAARAMALEARLLCTAARLLGKDLATVQSDLAAVDDLEKRLDAAPRATPIDDAIKLRSRCLARLTAARRPALRSAPDRGLGDELLSQLSQAKFEPFRDDRGVVVTLREVFQGGVEAPSAAAAERLTALGQVARERTDTPVLVVVHSARGAPTGKDEKRAEAVADVLRRAGAPRVEARPAGGVLPVLPPRKRGAERQNERVEVVFVTPSW